MFLGARLFFPDRHTWAIWAQENDVLTRGSSAPSQASAVDKSSKHRPPRRNTKSKVTTTDNFHTTDDYNSSMVRSVADDDILLVDKVIQSNESVDEMVLIM